MCGHTSELLQNLTYNNNNYVIMCSVKGPGTSSVAADCDADELHRNILLLGATSLHKNMTLSPPVSEDHPLLVKKRH